MPESTTPIMVQDDEERNDFSKWRLDPTQDIYDLMMDFKGYWYDAHKGEWVKTGARPIMNESGIRFVASALRRRVTRFHNLTNYTEDAINARVRAAGLAIAKALLLNHERYGISSRHFEEINESIRGFLFASYNKSLNAGEREAIANSDKAIRTIREQENRKGLLGFFRKQAKGGNFDDFN